MHSIQVDAPSKTKDCIMSQLTHECFFLMYIWNVIGGLIHEMHEVFIDPNMLHQAHLQIHVSFLSVTTFLLWFPKHECLLDLQGGVVYYFQLLTKLMGLGSTVKRITQAETLEVGLPFHQKPLCLADRQLYHLLSWCNSLWCLKKTSLQSSWKQQPKLYISRHVAGLDWMEFIPGFSPYGW